MQQSGERPKERNADKRSIVACSNSSTDDDSLGTAHQQRRSRLKNGCTNHDDIKNIPAALVAPIAAMLQTLCLLYCESLSWLGELRTLLVSWKTAVDIVVEVHEQYSDDHAVLLL